MYRVNSLKGNWAGPYCVSCCQKPGLAAGERRTMSKQEGGRRGGRTRWQGLGLWMKSRGLPFSSRGCLEWQTRELVDMHDAHKHRTVVTEKCILIHTSPVRRPCR